MKLFLVLQPSNVQYMETGVHGKSGIHVQRHVEVDQGHDVWNATTQSLHLGAQIVKETTQKLNLAL